MEVIDYSDIPDEAARLAFAKSPPCTFCGDKAGLAIGIVKSGASAGRLLLFCLCQLDPTEPVVE